MQALPSVNEAVAAHRADGCLHCKVSANRRDCPTLGLAIVTLDVIIRCRHIRKLLRDEPRRELHAAIQSRWLSDAEATALTEILDVLDLAANQVDAAGVHLPKLAGIGVAIIDGYRAAVTGALTK